MKKKEIILHRQTDRQTDDCNLSTFRLPAKRNAFSLAELMVVMLILTIILAATMPILSKRAKVKAAAAAASSNATTCMQVISSSLPANLNSVPPNATITLSSNIQTLSYTLIGGGGGASQRNDIGGGGGGSTAIVVNDVATIAKGGDGGHGVDNAISGFGQDGSIETGIVASPAGKTLAVYVGGGGGAAGSNYYANNFSGGGGGAGYYGGGGGTWGCNLPATKCYGGGGNVLGATSGGTAGVSNSSSSFNGSPGDKIHGGNGTYVFGFSTAYTDRINAGSGTSGGTSCSSYDSGGGGGGFGAPGGIGHIYPQTYTCSSGANSGNAAGTGKGGRPPNNGGDGGSAILIYTTKGSTCSLTE